MISFSSPFSSLPRALCAVTTTLSLHLCAGSALAAPGAHGPNGEHLDQKATALAGSALPRLEAKSELFELVANLHGGELSILIDRFESNEPVLGAQVEVETGALKAKAKFHADHGDYAVDDPEFLNALSAPGEHALVFTVVAGKDTDLLDGTLVGGNANAAAADHDHGLERSAWIGGGLLILGLLGGIGWWRQRARNGFGAVREMQS